MGKRITAVLQEHDAVLEWLARRCYETGGSQKSFFQREFLQALSSHVLAIRKVIQPALVECGVAAGLREWFEAIDELQGDLADAMTLRDDAMNLEAAITRLATRLSYLRSQEGDHLAGVLTSALTDGELRLLGAEVALSLAVRFDPEGDSSFSSLT